MAFYWAVSYLFLLPYKTTSVFAERGAVGCHHMVECPSQSSSFGFIVHILLMHDLKCYLEYWSGYLPLISGSVIFTCSSRAGLNDTDIHGLLNSRLLKSEMHLCHLNQQFRDCNGLSNLSFESRN